MKLRKFLLLLCILIISCSASLAAKIPDEVRSYIENNAPGSDIRFDGVVILPDNTIYLPLFPSLFSDINSLKVKMSVPKNKTLAQRPDVIIFNNDFVLLKVLTDVNGNRTVANLSNPPLQVRTGLLPQDMLVPSGLIIPENIKGIIGNLKVDTKSEDIIKRTSKESFEEFLDDKNGPSNNNYLVPVLKNKTLFVTTNYSKNIQVVTPPKSSPDYSLAQKSIPIDIEAVNNGKFVLVTSYERPFLDIISVADSRFIKQIGLGTFPDEIVIDNAANKAYVTSPKASTIFVIDLNTMSMIQKIRINGYCEKLTLAGDKIFYTDKLKGDIWAIETENNYTLRNIGNFPNISALMFSDNKLYIASRTKSRIAVIDYSTLGLEREFTTENKPLSMVKYNNIIYVLGAQNNKLQKIDTASGKPVGEVDLGAEGFSSVFHQIDNTQFAVIANIKNNSYTIFDLKNGSIVKTYSLNIPLKDIKVADKVELFE